MEGYKGGFMAVVAEHIHDEAKVNHLTERLMMAMEKEVRRILENMGLSVGAETSVESIHAQMKLADIKVKHFTFPESPKDNGYYFYKRGKPFMILSDPEMVNNEIKIERKWVA
jgi:hypothetical protein